MEDDDLEHSGIRGGRSCCLCVVIVILLIVAILNALVTAGLIYFLSITHEGMMSMEFFPDGGGYLRVLSDIGVENLTVHDQVIGRSGKDMMISGQEVTVGVTDGATITVNGNKTSITSRKFELTTSDGKPLFSTSSPLNLDLYQVKNLHAPAIDVGSIESLDTDEVTSSSMFPDLLIESFHKADVMGMEGVQVMTQGNVEIVAAGKDITINSLHDSLKFNQKKGIFIAPNLPLDGKGSVISKTGSQLKLCVCGSKGRVFAVLDRGTNSGCHLLNEDKDPCVD